MNLKENYERLFGQLDECDFSGRKVVPKAPKHKPTDEQMSKWLRLHKAFSTQYPDRKLSLSEGVVTLDGHLVENATDFLNRDIPTMIQVVRNTNRQLNG